MNPQVVPSISELRAFMERAVAPLRFEHRPGQPLKVSVEERVIYIDLYVLQEAVAGWIKHGWDWREQLDANIKHEKAHFKVHPYMATGLGKLDPKQIREARITREELTSLMSFLADYVIDHIYYGGDAEYQRIMRRDMVVTYEEYAKMTRYERREMLRLIGFSPYHAVAYYLAIGVIGWERIRKDFAEQRTFIREYADLMRGIKADRDLVDAIPKAVEIRKRLWKS